MAEENLKDFTVNWIIVGLLVFSLISFAISFMYNNNPLGFDDEVENKLTSTQSQVSTKLYAIEGDSDTILNITANTNPEASDLGSRDSVASAYQTKESAVSLFESIKLLIAWVLVGEVGRMLISVISGIIGFTSIYFIVKWIRNGF